MNQQVNIDEAKSKGTEAINRINELLIKEQESFNSEYPSLRLNLYLQSPNVGSKPDEISKMFGYLIMPNNEL